VNVPTFARCASFSAMPDDTNLFSVSITSSEMPAP
jgi:hypothetical protein